MITEYRILHIHPYTRQFSLSGHFETRQDAERMIKLLTPFGERHVVAVESPL